MATKNFLVSAAQLKCGNKACLQALFGQVLYCPFCGTAQKEKLDTAATPTSQARDSKPVVQDTVVEQIAFSDTSPDPQVERVPVERARAASEVDEVAVVDADQTPEIRVPIVAPIKKRKWGRYVAGGVFAVIAWKMLVPSGPDACETAITASTNESKSGSLDTAKAKALEAVAACKGDQQQRAKVVFADIEKRLTSVQGCETASNEYKTLVSEGRLRNASSLVDTKLRTCEASDALQARKKEIEEARRVASNSVEIARGKIQAGEFGEARTMVEEILRVDRDNPNIISLRTTIDTEERRALAASAAAAAAATAAAQPVPPPVAAPTWSSAQTAAANAADEMANAMLRDGEAALSQRRFSDAKALASSILRLVPSAQARDLMRRASEAESRALREDTTLR